MVCREFATRRQSTTDYSDHQLDTEAGEVTLAVGTKLTEFFPSYHLSNGE